MIVCCLIQYLCSVISDLPNEESLFTTSDENEPAVAGIFCSGVTFADDDGELQILKVQIIDIQQCITGKYMRGAK